MNGSSLTKASGILPGPEDGHAAAVHERSDAQDDTPCDESVQDRIVAWIHGHDLVPAGARWFPDDHRFLRLIHNRSSVNPASGPEGPLSSRGATAPGCGPVHR